MPSQERDILLWRTIRLRRMFFLSLIPEWRLFPSQHHQRVACSTSTLTCPSCVLFLLGISSTPLLFARRTHRLSSVLPLSLRRDVFFVSSLFNMRRFASGESYRVPSFTEVCDACMVLGVDIDYEQKQLKKVYRNLVRENHPDAGGDETKMSRITVAYNTLSGLSNSQRERFKAQKDAIRKGDFYASHGSSGHRGSSSNQHPFYSGDNSYAYNRRHTSASHRFYGASHDEFFRQANADQYGYHTQRQHAQTFTRNPYSSFIPFPFRLLFQRAWNIPLASFFLRVFVVYLVFSVFFLLIYRHYREWLKDDGWKMAESLSKYEQLAEIHRVREEMNERVRATREAALAAQSDSMRAFVNAENNKDTDRRASRYLREQELRALEQARRRQAELNEEVKGWPQFGDDKGRLIRRAQDPHGVVFFEPRKEDVRSRQLQNLQKGRERSDMNQHMAEANKKDITSGVHTAAAASFSVDSSASTNDDHTLSAINAIFNNLLGSAQESSREK